MVHLLSSALVGISYGMVFERESPDFAAGIAWGLLYGLVHRLICSWHMAAGQLAVFQGGSDERI
jgi:hypothetical protein